MQYKRNKTFVLKYFSIKMNRLNSQKIIVTLLLSMMAIIGKTFVKSFPSEYSVTFGNYSFQKSNKPNSQSTFTTDLVEVDREEEDFHTYTDFSSTISHLNDFRFGFAVVIEPIKTNLKLTQFIPNQKKNILYCSFLI